MGTLDNIYVLNFLINTQVKKKGGKLIALFVNLKAAFDSVGNIGGGIEAEGSKGGLIEKVEEMWETKSRMRVGRELGKSC